MQAIVYHRYGAPEVLELATVDTPKPGPGELRIRVRAAAVTSSDCAFRRGEPLVTRLFAGLRRPKQPILGTEFAGEVDAVGSGVTRLRPGDRVWAATGDAFGAHGEFLCLPEDGAIELAPEGMGLEEAVAISEGALTALPFLRDEAQLSAGQHILINGATGAVGSQAVQLARHMGAQVTAVCSTNNLDLARSLGAHQVLDYTREDFTQGSDRYDVIFDAAGKCSFPESRGVLNPAGIYLSPALSLGVVWHQMVTSRFLQQRCAIAFTGLRRPDEKRKDLRYLRELVEAGELRGVVGETFPSDQFQAAHRLAESGHKRGAAVLRMGTLQQSP